MAPRKNVESKTTGLTKTFHEKKSAKPKVKQLKPKLKTPTVIKLKIPFENLNNSKNMSTKVVQINKEMSEKLTKKQLTVEKKLDLANEVAAAQLGNKQLAIVETAPIVIIRPKLKRGRKKKIQESVPEPIATTEPTCSTEPIGSTNVGLATDSEDAFDLTPKKRKYIRRNPTTAAAKKPEAVQVTEGKVLIPLLPKKKCTKQTKLTDAKSGITKTPITATESKKISSFAPLVTRSKTEKNKLKPEIGKTDTNETPIAQALQSPSIIDQVKVSNLKKENALSANTESAGSPPNDQNAKPCSIDSRKTSLASECLSWTKDISSSSTTTCVTVCSTDIVRIDKKMPIIKLTPTTCHLNTDLNNIGAVNNTGADIASSSSDSDSSESDATPTPNIQRECTPEIESRSLNLSSPSVSPSKSLQPVTPTSSISCQNSVDNDEMTKITYCIDKLASKLKHFDLEIINWIGYENEELDFDRKKFQDNIFKMLKEENEVISHCRQLKKILLDNSGEEDANEKSKESVGKESDTKVDLNSVDNNATDRYTSQVISERLDEENNMTTDRVKYIPYDQSGDDDDALSLFAESITGIESSRRNSSAASICTTGDFEEYVPYPLTSEKWEPARKSYPPTRTVEKQNDIKTKPVCEKQNADSTSIYKETEQYSVVNNVVKSLEKNIPPTLSVNAGISKKKPFLMSYVFKPLTGVKSGVFQGMCFFNILSSCKKKTCRFPHVIPSYDEITAKLMRLSEETFIQEYMLLRNWPVLRRKYGMCFVHEGIRRDLTRILVEMALDFVMKANESCRDDTILKVLVSESVLLHLNSVNLEVCEDLLMYKYQGKLLCEILMQVIANTQNFSRFKQVFINLTKFILQQGRAFPLDVATQILERICILPSEPPLLEALLEIVKHTDKGILENSMLGHFENQLSVASKDLFDELLKLKKEGDLNRPVLQNLYEPSAKSTLAEIEPVNANPLVSEREKRYTSPDTTNLDSMNKSTDEPTITRTIDFSRAQLFGCTIQKSFSNSNSSNDSSEEFRPKVVSKPNFSSWKDRSIFNIIRGRSPAQMHSTPRPSIKRHVHQHFNFGPSAPKFPRRSGPDFF